MGTMKTIDALLDTEWERFDYVAGQSGYRHNSGKWIARRDSRHAAGMALYCVWGGNGRWVMDADLHTVVHYVDMVEREATAETDAVKRWDVYDVADELADVPGMLREAIDDDRLIPEIVEKIKGLEFRLWNAALIGGEVAAMTKFAGK